jgi:hypothetical protein
MTIPRRYMTLIVRATIYLSSSTVRSPDGANGSRECVPDDKLRALRDGFSTNPSH